MHARNQRSRWFHDENGRRVREEGMVERQDLRPKQMDKESRHRVWQRHARSLVVFASSSCLDRVSLRAAKNTRIRGPIGGSGIQDSFVRLRR